jgi:hypothetical protein
MLLYYLVLLKFSFCYITFTITYSKLYNHVTRTSLTYTFIGKCMKRSNQINNLLFIVYIYKYTMSQKTNKINRNEK